MDHELTTVAELLVGQPPDLAQPGGGRTTDRFDRLWEIAAVAPSSARLLEAHYDARAILREAGQQPDDSRTFAVWAAGGPDPLTLGADGRLRGTKHWCSGASLVTHALVTAAGRGSNVLVEVPIGVPGVVLEPPTWVSPAFTG